MIAPSAPLCAPLSTYPNITAETHSLQNYGFTNPTPQQYNTQPTHGFTNSTMQSSLPPISNPQVWQMPHENLYVSTTLPGQAPFQLVPYQIRNPTENEDNKVKTKKEEELESNKNETCVLTKKKAYTLFSIFGALVVIVVFFLFIIISSGVYQRYV
uniref:Uncharacterized protein n=1 Tax=Acrobeloides nanus TaxID=290746 RepID=A0A914E3P1_9BILA